MFSQILRNFQFRADIFDCAIFLYTLYIVFLHVGDNPTVGSTENPQCGSTMSVNKWQRMKCGKKGRYVNVIRAVPNSESQLKLVEVAVLKKPLGD
jgi:hypothetical protein